MKLLKFHNKKEKYHELIKHINELNHEILTLKYIYFPALRSHISSFASFKNINKNKKVVLVGSGSSLNSYTPIENACHIGVNHTFLNNKLKLDYLFIQDNLGKLQKKANNYASDTCIKFYGKHYIVTPPSEADIIEANAKIYYFYDQPVPTANFATCSTDITTRPLNTWSSVIFPALEFALWTYPKELYIVGCDCTNNGHFLDKNYNLPHIDRILYGWKQMEIFADNHYPSTKIIPVNSKGLEAIFK